MPPVDSWGSEYHSLELDRGKDKGDYFRVVAGEDNVTFEIVWYDKETKERISDIGPITLPKKGNWFEYNGAGAITSIEDSGTREIRILDPQPIVSNRLNIELPNYLNNTLTLSDIEGNILRTVDANGSQISIDISDLSSGAYFINISDGKS
jgi:hypothetical protein